MRIIVVGAGAVSGVVAANLTMSGTPVVVVARSEHARVMRESELRYESPTGTRIVEVPVAASIAEIDVTDDDVLLLGVKSQDTLGVLNDVRAGGDIRLHPARQTLTAQPLISAAVWIARRRENM